MNNTQHTLRTEIEELGDVFHAEVKIEFDYWPEDYGDHWYPGHADSVDLLSVEVIKITGANETATREEFGIFVELLDQLAWQVVMEQVNNGGPIEEEMLNAGRCWEGTR